MSDASEAMVDRTVLPAPDPQFRGKIEVAFHDSEADFAEPLKPPAGAPNVLLIMGDDVGYGHTSTFGGPANTPTFDRLSKRGLIYNNFHTTAVCAASRAALLTGRNTHKVAMGGVPEISTRLPGYNFSTADTFDVGEDWGTPMSDDYETPFAFTGKIKTVTVHAKSP